MKYYELEYTDDAKDDIQHLKKSGDKVTLKKLETLLLELTEHPTTGTGNPEKLKNNLSGKWSRRINHRHRLVYEIHEMTITIVVVNAYGHYSDK
ncbi:Toxin RelK [termite gut metagenome]|uniref:Putative mRNA interferase YoeB n=1 Tax=termite gut metagenome TaxID=433724 RepID=A0A5J4S5X5_9ZZZZ